MKNSKQAIELLKTEIDILQKQYDSKGEALKSIKKECAKRITEILEKKSKLFVQFGCRVQIDNFGFEIKIPIKYREFDRVIDSTQGVTLRFEGTKLSDISTGLPLTNFGSNPDKIKGGGLVYELGTAALNEEPFIEQIAVISNVNVKEEAQESEIFYKLNKLKDEIKRIEKYSEATGNLMKRIKESCPNIPQIEFIDSNFSKTAEKFLREKGVKILRDYYANGFNASGNKNEIIETIVERLYI